MAGKLIDLTGQSFGRLTVTGRADSPGKPRWNCTCSCGAACTPSGSNLRHGLAKSCGCIREEVRRTPKWAGAKVAAHQGEYNSWSNARRRCEDPRDKAYPAYGGQGIRMCERWRNDFAAFLADMGEKPGPSYSIDRIDNERGYEPGNCRWATPALQTLNRRCTRWLSLRGELVAVADASRRFGVRRCTIYGRLRSGWTEEDAVFGKVA
jgi:hypothetical protein